MDQIMPKNLLVTGPPGCGKTTLVRKIVQELGSLPMTGFYTEEIREGRDRVGFALVGLDGRRGVLSHVKVGGPYRVGRYGVDIAGFESFLQGLDSDESRSPPYCHRRDREDGVHLGPVPDAHQGVPRFTRPSPCHSRIAGDETHREDQGKARCEGYLHEP